MAMVTFKNPGMHDAAKNRLLYPLNVWALSFGCAVGWGSFVMPGTLFLPNAGPIGSALAIFIGGISMVIIGYNFCQLAVRYQGNGGIYAYTKNVLGHDHAFLAAWTLLITYLSIIWANATAVVLLCRMLFGSLLQWGFHYTVAGFDVYFGEIVTTWIVFITFGAFTCYGGKLKRHLYTAFALLLISIIILLFVSLCIVNHNVVIFPPFQQDNNPLLQVFSMLMVAPWMFFGYECVTHAIDDFHFPVQKLFPLIVIAVVCGVLAYTLLIGVAILSVPPEYTSWKDYIDNVGHMQGMSSLPVFHSIGSTYGMAGIWVLGVAVLSGIATCILGLYRTCAYLLQFMAKDGLLPLQFTKTDLNGVPRNALFLTIAMSLPIPLLGRTAIVWLVDIITISGSLAYGYVSLCNYLEARKNGDKRGVQMGIGGMVFSLFFFFCPLLPNLLLGSSLNTESYLLLAVWSTLGFLYYWYIFKRDTLNHFGRSASLSILLMFLNFFSTGLWLRQSTRDQLALAVEGRLAEAHSKLTFDLIVQMLLIMTILFLVSNIFTRIRQRERLMDIKMMQERQVSLVKSNFLANVSHDIRLPMKALSGYVRTARQAGSDFRLSEGDCDMQVTSQLCDCLSRIQSVCYYLKAFVNDLQKVDYIDKNSFDLKLKPTDLRQLMQRIVDSFAQQMKEKDISFALEISQVEHPLVLCDGYRLSRILLNLLSNSHKFTPSGGRIVVMLIEKESPLSPAEREKAHIPENENEYELRVQDTGIGMSESYAKEMFIEKENRSIFAEEEKRPQGMMITKYLIDLMGGTIKVITAPEEGTEFIINLKLTATPKEADVVEA